MKPSRLLALALACAAFSRAGAQAPTLPLAQSKLDARAADPKFRIPLDSTSDARWLGGGVGAPRWSVEGDWVYFQYSLDPKPVDNAPPDDPWWRVSKDGKRVESVARRDAARIPAGVTYTRDAARAMWFWRNELTYWKRGSEPRVLISRTRFMSPRWSPDERTIRWDDSNAVYEIDPETGAQRQLTAPFVQTAKPTADKIKDELKREQQQLFDFVKRQMALRDSSAKLALGDPAWRPVTTPTKANDALSFIDIVPGCKCVTYLITPRVQPELTHFSDFVNESGIVIDQTSRAKVGQAIAMTRVAIVPNDPALHPDSVKVTYVDDSTGFGKQKVIPVSTLWNRQGTRFVVEFQSTDYKDRWIALVDPMTGKRTRELHHIHDEAWFGGAGPAQGWLAPSWMQFLPDGETLAITSEESGWNHLYLVTMDGAKTAVTSGDWEVRQVIFARDESKWFIGAGIEHPDEMHIYEVPLRGGKPRRIDDCGEGEITPTLSPDQKTLAFRWTSPSQLMDLYVMPMAGGAATQITRSGTDAFWKIAWLPSDFVSFPDDRGKPVFARVYRPKTQNPTRAAVMEIHGAGYAQGVHKNFGGASAHGGRLYAQYLAERGVTYMVLDYRGSAGYGRDMRTDVYRSMGEHDVNSAVAAIPFLEKNYKVSAKNVGLYGCSYGGFFTLMALFKHPGTFQAGAAQCSVTDWAHYNHGYTARILNGAPADDTTAYKVSSPIWHADGLKDKLLLQHGLVDNNVEYQDAVRLVQRLMELGKDFDFVTYPIEAHGWSTRWSKIDSQRRVTKLWEETILKPASATTRTTSTR
ncbi:MAG TPA: prolyl oligopeptidase family serine peptidase [Gemmatimonadaceae bacterium]|nr:prolyl oligopeptidase family serine peptidase [Gemmatimonadaceae bacterium]